MRFDNHLDLDSGWRRRRNGCLPRESLLNLPSGPSRRQSLSLSLSLSLSGGLRGREEEDGDGLCVGGHYNCLQPPQLRPSLLRNEALHRLALLPLHHSIPPFPAPNQGSASPVPQSPEGYRRDADLRRVFAIFDHNNDGFITREELKESMENVGLFLSDEELESMVRNLDADGDGCLDLEEFCVLYESMTGGGKGGTGDEESKGVGEATMVVGDDELKEAFDVFDVNGDGFISVEELSLVLGSLRLKNGWRECKEMIQKVDLDGDGRVNFQEFQKMMKAGGFTSLC
ncbi:calmodulin-like protein 7 [Nymphaea colorata]|nr:calmodulin-like protein 7 [Nymphaea colorata]